MTQVLFDDLKALREQLSGAVGPSMVFVEGPFEHRVGARARFVLRAQREGLEVPISGLIAWRYPASHTPPGKRPGLGLLLDDETRAHTLFRSVTADLEPGAPPGGRLPALLSHLTTDSGEWDTGSLESYANSWEEHDTLGKEDHVTAQQFGDDFDDEDTISHVALPSSASEDLVVNEEEESARFEHEDTRPPELHLEASVLSAPSVRPLPDADPAVDLPIPDVEGRAFMFGPAYRVATHVAAIEWPDAGTKRRTWFEIERDRGRSVDELIAGDPSVAERNTDPGVVEPPTEGPTLALPVSLFIDRGKDAPKALFEAGASLPARANVKVKGSEVTILASRWGEGGHDVVGTLTFEGAPPKSARANFVLDTRGILVVRLGEAEDRLETGLVPVPLHHELDQDRGLITTLKRLFKNE